MEASSNVELQRISAAFVAVVVQRSAAAGDDRLFTLRARSSG